LDPHALIPGNAQMSLSSRAFWRSCPCLLSSCGRYASASVFAIVFGCGSPDSQGDGADGTASGGNASGSSAIGGSTVGGSEAGGGGGTAPPDHAGMGGTGIGVPTGGGGSAGAAGHGDTTQGGGGATGNPPTGTIIVNDAFWKDTSGELIYSQGGGVLFVDDTYYWYGVRYGNAASYATGTQTSVMQGVTTYSSKDLVHWKSESFSSPGASGWFGRIGVVYHAATKKYVLAGQGGGGLYFATSDSPGGPFVYNNVQTNLAGVYTGKTGDQTMFQDDDGAAYVVASSSSGRANRYLLPLRASDFLYADEPIAVYSGGGREGNAMFKYKGTYYYCGSDLHGWNTSTTYCVSSSSIKGSWSSEFVVEGTQLDYSHVTQNGFFISVQGTEATTIIYAGDRWANFAGNGIGYNQWVPLSFDGKTAHFNSLSKWSINAKTGTWAVAPGNNYVLNPSFEADRISVSTPIGWKSTNGRNLEEVHTGRWSWQLSSNGTLQQQITAIPDGTYTLSVWARAAGSGAHLTAKGCGGPDSTTPIPAGSAFASVKSLPIAVKGGNCTVGVSAGGGVTIDDFTLADE
jgi:hypothetical protein